MTRASTSVTYDNRLRRLAVAEVGISAWYYPKDDLSEHDMLLCSKILLEALDVNELTGGPVIKCQKIRASSCES